MKTKLLTTLFLLATLGVMGQGKLKGKFNTEVLTATSVTKHRTLYFDTTQVMPKPGKIAALVNQDGTLKVIDSLETINFLWDYYKKQSKFIIFTPTFH